MSNDKNSYQSLLKFDAYDVFGYIVPGSVVLGGMYIHLQYSEVGGGNIVNDFLSTLSLDINKWYHFLGLSTFVLFIVYIAGHLVALFASGILEKLLVERTAGFPYEQLFKSKYEVSSYEEYKRKIYKVIFSISIFVLIWIACRGLSRTNAIVFGSILIASIGVKLLYTTIIRPQEVIDGLVKETTHSPPREVKFSLPIRGLLLLCSLPFNIAVWILLCIFMRRKRFRVETQNKFEELFTEVFDVNLKVIETDVFWLCYSYLCQNEPASAKLIQHLLQLCAFCRNLSMAFLILFIYGALMSGLVKSQTFNHLMWYLLTGLAAMLFAARFYYIYYNYYSKLTFRSFITAAQKRKSN